MIPYFDKSHIEYIALSVKYYNVCYIFSVLYLYSISNIHSPYLAGKMYQSKPQEQRDGIYASCSWQEHQFILRSELESLQRTNCFARSFITRECLPLMDEALHSIALALVVLLDHIILDQGGPGREQHESSQFE